MIYELRVYRVVQGRMAALLTRFEHQTLPIMVRHGILQVGFWKRSEGAGERATALGHPVGGRSAMSVPKATGRWFSSSWKTANFAVFKSFVGIHQRVPDEANDQASAG
jgi:hypothetical protein